MRQSNIGAYLIKNAEKYSKCISTEKYVQILAANENQADCKILAASENQADCKILAASENQANCKILACVEISAPGVIPAFTES